MEYYTRQEIESRTGIQGLNNMTIRFFTIAVVDDEMEEIEINEGEFLELVDKKGTIQYTRHTVFSNGVDQVILSITPEEFN